MRVFISGGCKSGKSLHAQRIAKKMHIEGTPLYYIATMMPADGEDYARIQEHRIERQGLGFKTMETFRDISAAVKKCGAGGTILLDSVTALLANEMFGAGCADKGAPEKIARELNAIVKDARNIVVVSDYIYSDAILYGGLTECYRAGLAAIAIAVARVSDVAAEANCGRLTVYKGAEIFENFYNEYSYAFC